MSLHSTHPLPHVSPSPSLPHVSLTLQVQALMSLRSVSKPLQSLILRGGDKDKDKHHDKGQSQASQVLSKPLSGPYLSPS